jgi:hypothetical protein
MTATRLALAAAVLFAAALPAGATDVEQRVKFARGGSSATLSGTIGQPKVRRVGEVRDRYLLGARKGQTLEVAFTATKPIMVAVWHTDYHQGYLGFKTGTKGVLTFELPANADYNVDVETTGTTKRSDYRLTVGVK